MLRTQIDDNGRVLIPASLRKQHNIKSGDVYVSRVIDGEIHLISLKKAISNAQAIIREHIPEGHSLVDELIEIRQQDREIG